jgi:DNA repair protein RadD
MKQLRPYQQEVLEKLRAKLKETDYPLLVNASVGAGKSLIIAELLRIIEKTGWHALCLTMNSTLIRQNADTYIAQGGHAGIYCAALGMKETHQPIIFASPMSVLSSIKASGKLSKIPFNLIIIDECHNINFNEKNTTYMQIFNHYSMHAQTLGHKLRFVGLTGTPYRGKGHTIVGEKLFFKEEVCAITADWLIENTYLTPPVWGYCKKTLQYDFHELKINTMGRFNAVELDQAVHKKPRLTGKIMVEVTEIVKNRKGAFIFASSIKHCHECAEWLPPEETAIITGDTSDKMREHYITQARAGIIKYLVNINVLCTGVDVPTFDTVVFVRPTESLVLYMQCLGRGLRLADGKTDCLILDYAGNLERHGDIDNPVINKAIQPRDPNDPDYCIECFNCNAMNTLMSRRCIGTKDDKRCDHWFEWRDCPGCGTKNDIVSRQCRSCHTELIDPNRNLRESASNKNKISLQVKETEYSLSMVNGFPRFDVRYIIDMRSNPTRYQLVQENFLLNTEKSVRFFYHTMAKLHFMHPHQAYSRLQNIQFLKSVIENGELYSPKSIECVEMDNNRLTVVNKIFDHAILEQDLRQLDVIYTFYDFNKFKNTITFEYLVRENETFSLIIDNYRINIPTCVKRFLKNYGSGLGTDIESISDNKRDLLTPTKIWVNVNNRMQRFVEDAPKIDWEKRFYFVCSRVNLNRAYEKWCEIVKIEVFSNHIAYDKNDKFFKVFRVHIYAYYKAHTQLGNEYDGLICVKCNLSESDLDRVQSKEFRYLQVIADGRHAEDIEQWKTAEDRIFLKQSCVNYRS